MVPSLFDRLVAGDHVCDVYDDEEQRLTAVARFVRVGVGGGNRVVHFSAGSPEKAVDELVTQGVDARALCETGALQVYAAGDTYLASGSFDPEAAIDGWRRMLADALEAGYAGLWALGDMSWAASQVPGVERLHWYEAEVNRVFSGGQALAMCLYDRRTMPPEALDRISAAHPSRLGPGPDESWVPLLRMRRTAVPPGLALTGEADASNREALAATLAGLREDLPDARGPLTVDLSELRFADAAVARLLIESHRALRGGIRVIGCPPQVARLLQVLGGEGILGAVDRAEVTA
ncbi:MEDS domain-containing protein [Microbispora sp. NPDC049633]|uniref:MEDS domain-containing protein n=1 Tax=Microbispora sp. NPDC049633 TaxID=3154355 RepID=UPI00341A72F1